MAPRRFTSSCHHSHPVPIPNQPDITTTNTVIVGNGPSALFLSYLLHGNVPIYDPTVHGPHPDPILHQKLLQIGPNRPLYDALDSPKACSALTEHFSASTSMSYSTQALPINVLLDTLMRPNADTEIGETRTRIRWDRDPSRRVDHLVLGDAGKAGGQWAEDAVGGNWDCETLSYAEMLSLPAYTYSTHYRRLHSRSMPDLIRPTRREVASYYAAYPKAVGISPEVFTSVHAQRICQLPDGRFKLRVHCNFKTMTIICTHLVLATGIYSQVIPPPPIYTPLLTPALGPTITGAGADAPLLVVGSGFTAADVIGAAEKAGRKVLHVYKWNPARPSPLKGCHAQAYPEYAGVYRRMKAVAAGTAVAGAGYEGWPNARVVAAGVDGKVGVLSREGEVVERWVGGLRYCVGRRGSLEYLSPELRRAVGVVDAGWISGDTMRVRVEEDLEVVGGMFVVGSLTGDSLVRFGFGGGVYAAGRILGGRGGSEEGEEKEERMAAVGAGVERRAGVGGRGTCVIS